jgi:hypothetical protein
MGGQNAKPTHVNPPSIEPDEGMVAADTSRMAPHQINSQTPEEDLQPEIVEPAIDIVTEPSEERKEASGEDIDSLIEYLESDQMDQDLKGSGHSCSAKNSDLDDLVEMLERDVFNSSTEPKRTPAATPVEPIIPELPSTPFKDFLSPLASARSKTGKLAVCTATRIWMNGLACSTMEAPPQTGGTTVRCSRSHSPQIAFRNTSFRRPTLQQQGREGSDLLDRRSMCVSDFVRGTSAIRSRRMPFT